MRTLEKILVVEDEAGIRQAVAAWLTKHGYRVVEAVDGREAIEQATRAQPALIVMDVEMPEMGGLHAIQHLRELGNRVPILVLSSRTEVGERVQGLTVGADDYLGKPFDYDELLARVRALLRRNSPEVEVNVTEFRLPGLTIDFKQMKADVGGRVVRLSRTECAILQLLARTPGEPVSREKMFDLVWGYTRTPNTRTVDTHIWRLRRKLGGDQGGPGWIENVSGVGYRLNGVAGAGPAPAESGWGATEPAAGR